MPTIVLAVALLLSAAGQNPDGRLWIVVGKPGLTRLVYASPKVLADRALMARMLYYSALDVRGPTVQVFVYDDRRFTPSDLPMTDAQMKHWRARYSRNRNTGLEEFVWVTSTGRGKTKERPDSIRPAK
jgi:hypothetical protein